MKVALGIPLIVMTSVMMLKMVLGLEISNNLLGGIVVTSNALLLWEVRHQKKKP